MEYSDKLEIVKASLISYCKDCITNNWGGMFDMWLMHEADMELGHGYQNICKEQFDRYMTSEIEEKLWLSGKNIVFAMNAFLSYKRNAKIEEILTFTEAFLIEQLNDFDNWCDGICIAMYERSSDNV